MGFQRPLLDATPPDAEALARSLPEHLHWECLPQDARSGLVERAAGEVSTSDVQHAVARSAVDGMRVHRHVVEASVPFSRRAPHHAMLTHSRTHSTVHML